MRDALSCSVFGAIEVALGFAVIAAVSGSPALDAPPAHGTVVVTSVEILKIDLADISVGERLANLNVGVEVLKSPELERCDAQGGVLVFRIERDGHVTGVHSQGPNAGCL